MYVELFLVCARRGYNSQRFIFGYLFRLCNFKFRPQDWSGPLAAIKDKECLCASLKITQLLLWHNWSY